MSASTPGAMLKSTHRTVSHATFCSRRTARTCSAISSLLDGDGPGLRVQISAVARRGGVDSVMTGGYPGSEQTNRNGPESSAALQLRYPCLERVDLGLQLGLTPVEPGLVRLAEFAQVLTVEAGNDGA